MKSLVFLFILFETFGCFLPKKLWIYWGHGIQNAMHITKLCVKNTQTIMTQSGWDVILLDKTNIQPFIPGILQELKKPFFVERQKESHQADLIRLALLKQYGGVFIDANSILLQNLDWLYKLKQNPDVINKNGKNNPQVFTFYLRDFVSDEQFKLQNNETVRPNVGYQGWFIAAVHNSKLMKQWYNTYLQLVNGRDQYIDKVFKQNQIILGRVAQFKDHYLLLTQSLYFLLQTKQKQLNKYNHKGQPTKYAVHQYGLWTMDSKVGPHLFLHYSKQEKFAFSYALQSNIQSVKKHIGQPKYLIKISQYYYKNLQIAIRLHNQSLNPKWFLNNYYISQIIWTTFLCSQIYRIQENSIIDNYILKRSQKRNPSKLWKTSGQVDLKCTPNYMRIFYVFILFVVTVLSILKLLKYKNNNDKTATDSKIIQNKFINLDTNQQDLQISSFNQQ